MAHGVPGRIPNRSEWYPSDKCFEYPSVAPAATWAKTYNKWRQKLPKAVGDVIPKKNEISLSGFVSRSPTVLIFRFQGRFIELERRPGSSGGTMHEPWQISFVDDAGVESPVDVQTWDESPTAPADYDAGWVMIESFPRRSEWLHVRVRPTHDRVELATSPVAAEMRFRNPARDLSSLPPPPKPAEAVAQYAGTSIELTRLTRSKAGAPGADHRMECEFQIQNVSKKDLGLDFATLWLGDDSGNVSRECFGHSGGSRIQDGKTVVYRKWNGSIWSDVPAWKMRLEVSRSRWQLELFSPSELYSFKAIPAPTDTPQKLNQSATVGPITLRLSQVLKRPDGVGELQVVMERPASLSAGDLIVVHAQDDQGRIKGPPSNPDHIFKDELSSSLKHSKGTYFITYKFTLNLQPDAKTFDVSFATEKPQVLEFRVPLTVVD